MTAKTTPVETTAETFEFSDWFGDANLPEASADIFTNSAIIGQLAELQRRIETEAQVEEAEEAERGLGSKKAKTTLSALESQYVELAQQFEASKVTVFCKAVLSTERVEIRKAHEKAMKASVEGNEGFTFRMIAASIIGLQKHGEERKPATLTVPQVEDLYKRIGDAQIGAIFDAEQTASNAVPTVDADFLQRLSGPADTQES